MTLLAEAKIINNDTLRARTVAGIRKEAAARLEAEGAAGVLARAAYIAPETVVASFLRAVSTNVDVSAAACAACGNAPVDDQTLIWIIGDTWALAAAELYPEAGA